METTALPDYERGLTFEKVWAALMEDRESQRELRESQRKTDQQMEKTDRQMKKLSRQMGDLHNKFGKIAEHLVAPGITRRFNELGFRFDAIATGGQKILDSQGKIRAEIDLLLENGDYIIAVEVKTQPKVKDIEHHIRRMEILREVRQKKNDHRKILGAIAGAIFENDAKQATIEAGMYVIEQSGDTMKIDIPDGFIPKEW